MLPGAENVAIEKPIAEPVAGAPTTFAGDGQRS